MKKNYALFLKWMLALGLIFSIGLTGCENAVGETGPAGQDYSNKLQIVRSGGSESTVVARGTTAEFRVQYEGADVPDPASVSWNVWGVGQEKSVNTTVSWGTGYSGHTLFSTDLTVASNEPAEVLILEASYKGWTQTREVTVGIPYNALFLEQGGATNMGTSHITQYPWAGKEGGTLGKDADASTYLVYKKGERIADLRAGDATPADIVGTYHLNDDILVAPGDWVTFFEVDAANPARIISYGSDLAYIYAEMSSRFVPGTLPPAPSSNIRLPLTDELPTISGFFTSSTNLSTGTDKDTITGGFVGSGGDANGLARAKIDGAGTKNLSGGYTVTLVPEVDLFVDADYSTTLQKSDGNQGWTTVSGYDLKTVPTGFGMGANTSATPDTGLAIVQKTGIHRYIVKHDSGAWSYTTGNIPAITPSREGINVTQNQVLMPFSAMVGASAPGNILTITGGSFVNNVDVISGALTGKAIKHGNVKWAVDADNYAFDSSLLVIHDKDIESVKVLFSGTGPTSGDLTLESGAFSVGLKPLKDDGSDLTGTWSTQVYAQIIFGGTLPAPSSGKFGPSYGSNGTLMYTVEATSWGLPLLAADATGDKITISWYTVEGPDWTVIPADHESPPSPGTTLPSSSPLVGVGATANGFGLNAAGQYSAPSYASTLSVYLGLNSGVHTPGVYGKTVGVWVKPSGAANDVKFVDKTTGERVASQFIVGTIAQ